MLSGKNWDLLMLLRFVAGLFGFVLLGGIIVQYGLPKDSFPESERRFLIFIISTLSLHGGSLVLAAILLRAHGETWVSAFGLDRWHRGGTILVALCGFLARFPVCWALSLVAVGLMKKLDRWHRGGTILLALCGLLASIPFCWALSLVAVGIMKLAGLEAATQPTVEVFQGITSPMQKSVFAVVAVVLAPVVEEILFRGIFYTAVKQLGFPRLALWGTSLVFAMTHASLTAFLPLTFLALLLVWLYERTGNLLACILTHAGFNLVNLVLMMYMSQPAP